MTREEACAKIKEAIEELQFDGTVQSYTSYGSGHINDTFLVKSDIGGKERKYILQRMNQDIFKNPAELMENIEGVTSYLQKQIIEKGGNPDRETLNIVPTQDGKSFFVDSMGHYWRGYYFIEGASSYDRVEKPEDFYRSAVAFGNFQKMLAQYPAHKLHETIVDFHNTIKRFENLKKAIEMDAFGRAKEVQAEIEFAMKREADAAVCVNMQKNGELPLRVTHNDTKLNNILLDDKTGEGICVIDLDTVMPGLAINDFGDSIRFGANTGEEDEKDLSKVTLSLSLYDIYTKGFLGACGESLTQNELDLLPMGAKLMTFECGIRFLTDYLEGDEYFKIHREGQNLDRCRTQFKLVWDMEQKWDQMRKIVDQYR